MGKRAIMEAENMEIVQNKLNSIIKTNENLSKNIETLMDKHVPESQLSNVNELLAAAQGGKQCKNVRKILDCCAGPDNVDLDVYKKAYDAAVECEKANSAASEAVKKIIDSINGNGSNKLVSDFNLEFFYEYLNSLNILEVSALYHILMLLSIGINIFNVLSAILGNEIIKYFKLEENFPKLAIILRLRLKFQKYYLILSFSLIFLVIIVSILIDLLILI